jgi:hypothetical protein
MVTTISRLTRLIPAGTTWMVGMIMSGEATSLFCAHDACFIVLAGRMAAGSAWLLPFVSEVRDLSSMNADEIKVTYELTFEASVN